MSTEEILEQLPKLQPADLRAVRDRVWQLEEEELLRGASISSEDEKAMLDRELDEYAQQPNAGASWVEVGDRLTR